MTRSHQRVQGCSMVTNHVIYDLTIIGNLKWSFIQGELPRHFSLNWIQIKNPATFTTLCVSSKPTHWCSSKPLPQPKDHSPGYSLQIFLLKPHLMKNAASLVVLTHRSLDAAAIPKSQTMEPLVIFLWFREEKWKQYIRKYYHWVFQ